MVALAALIMAGGNITDEDEISAWCLENEAMSEGQLIEMARRHVRGADLAEETSGEAAAGVKREPLITPVKGPRSNKAARPEFDSLSDVSLMDQLNNLWVNFMRDVSELEASENINFSELAVVLEKLVNGYSSRPHRSFPTYMQGWSKRIELGCVIPHHGSWPKGRIPAT